MLFEDIEATTISSAEASLSAGDFDSLLRQVIAVSLYSNDIVGAQSLCLRVAQLPHAVARGNAILGLGHLARRSAALTRSLVEPLVLHALHDPEPYVRGQADAAADDIEQFLGWCLRM